MGFLNRTGAEIGYYPDKKCNKIIFFIEKARKYSAQLWTEMFRHLVTHPDVQCVTISLDVEQALYFILDTVASMLEDIWSCLHALREASIKYSDMDFREPNAATFVISPNSPPKPTHSLPSK